MDSQRADVSAKVSILPLLRKFPNFPGDAHKPNIKNKKTKVNEWMYTRRYGCTVIVNRTIRTRTLNTRNLVWKF